jgi:hypothetical protein
MADAPDFTKLVPGFDFLQGLVKNAGSALPGIGQWVAPTLNPEELDKRIDELRTVQFWLEQNARMLAATIQALEVQRMTLSTLKTMNVQMGDLRDSLQIKMPEMKAPAPSAAPAPAAAPQASPAPAAAPAAAAVDPMQWWNALTQQFSELAASAMKDNPHATALGRAGALMPKAPKAAAAPAARKASAPRKAPAAARKRASKPSR